MASPEASAPLRIALTYPHFRISEAYLYDVTAFVLYVYSEFLPLARSTKRLIEVSL